MFYIKHKMDTGTNLEWKTLLEKHIGKDLEDYDVNWRYVYNRVKEGGWKKLLKKTRNSDETRLALNNIKSNVSGVYEHVIENEDLESLKLLLNNKKIKFDEIDVEMAAKNSFGEAVIAMIEAGEISGEDALFRACIANNPYTVRMLLDYGVNPARKKNLAITWVFKYDTPKDANIDEVNENTYKIIQMLLEDKRVDPGVKDSEVLIDAIERNNIKVVNLLLEDGRVNPGVKNNKAIKTAAKNNRFEIIKILLMDSRVDPSVNDNEVMTLIIGYLGSRNYHKYIKTLSKKDAGEFRLNILNLMTVLFNDKRVYSKLSDEMKEQFLEMLGG